MSEELDTQLETANAEIAAIFKQWDTAGIPSHTELTKTKKDDLIALIESYLENPPSRGSKPKVGTVVKALLTNRSLDLIPKDTFCEMIRDAFNTRGIKCEIKSMDWYPSAKGFTAVPRRK